MAAQGRVERGQDERPAVPHVLLADAQRGQSGGEHPEILAAVAFESIDVEPAAVALEPDAAIDDQVDVSPALERVLGAHVMPSQQQGDAHRILEDALALLVDESRDPAPARPRADEDRLEVDPVDPPLGIRPIERHRGDRGRLVADRALERVEQRLDGDWRRPSARQLRIPAHDHAGFAPGARTAAASA
ncbi:hypothetical protein [Schumannella sp. 10F1B-5-1]|uniref:hypothetical protein n=1 Tax=Schumannella sp. 10F1B-5-1 TaxID=2590780 RepID=UPI0021060219|nr:hypothetical protein [Schumannella sp. 10F1B-5-1]